MKIAILFARSDSIYHQLDADVWDEDRDARQFPGAGHLADRIGSQVRAVGSTQNIQGLNEPTNGTCRSTFFVLLYQ